MRFRTEINPLSPLTPKLHFEKYLSESYSKCIVFVGRVEEETGDNRRSIYALCHTIKVPPILYNK